MNNIEDDPAVLFALNDTLPSWCSPEAQSIIEKLRNSVISLREKFISSQYCLDIIEEGIFTNAQEILLMEDKYEKILNILFLIKAKYPNDPFIANCLAQIDGCGKPVDSRTL